MIVYQSTKLGFSKDVLNNNIENAILEAFKMKLGRTTNKNEIESWKNSMMYMENILQDNDIPEDSGVMIEYQIPQTSKRIDFILTGQNENFQDYAIIVELKQWSNAQLTEKDGIVSTYVGQACREVNHPSYQVWSYAALLKDYNEAVYQNNINLLPCAYLHNYIESKKVISNIFYKYYIDQAPIFLRGDAEKLRQFIKKYVKFGDKNKIIYLIDKGKIKPSKNLADSLVGLLKGNKEFILLDDQKVVYENALWLINKAAKRKQVLIVEGGPGTGKSVVAINLLVEFTNLRKVVQYVTKNAAPRAVYQSKLSGTLRKTEISNLFVGSGSFVSAKKNTFDVLIIDEAHRLNEKSGMFKNMGENQIKEIMNASKLSIFFIDEDQKVTMSDIGEKDEIIKWADKIGADISIMELSSQFRCNGSDGYLAWLDNALQIRETANIQLKDIGFDFQVMDSPSELRDLIFEKNIISNKARLVAGYCWNWVSKKNKNLYDIMFPNFNFSMKWNLAMDSYLWILGKDSVNQVGCIHTCQGLELDYVGVIIGPDLIVRNGEVLVDPTKRAKTDMSLKGYKSLMKKDEAASKKVVKATFSLESNATLYTYY